MPYFASSNNRTLPRRTDSLLPMKAHMFLEIEEELHDVKRVHTHGQEEDLRLALSRTINRVEELSSMLKEAYKAQTDLQTELTLAKSNLSLALANNEMLEDALKRNGAGQAKEVGWRRLGAKERDLEDMRRQSVDSFDSATLSPSIPSGSPYPTPSPAPSDGRFFKFRFGSGNSASTSSFPPSSPRLPGSIPSNVNGPAQQSHLTSASLPSLVPAREKELEDLTAELERERKALQAATTAKEALEAELESLSQALFEEANNMVATERRKLAETEDELREALAEKEALRTTLRLVEHQRGSPNPGDATEPPPEPLSSSISRHSHRRSTSSAIAIKSPPLSGHSSPVSLERALDEPLLLRPTVPPPISIPATNGPPLSDSSPAGGSEAASDDKSPPEASEPQPSSSPTPSARHYTYSASRPPTFFEGEESPWADAKSNSPRIEV